MSEMTILKAEKREAAGTAAARRMRRTGSIPAVVYGGKANLTVKLDAHSFGLMIRRHGEHQIMDLQVEGESAGKVLVKALQHDPLDSSITHVDFVEVSMNKPIQLNLPIALTGEAAGIKAGGILEFILSEIEVECLPGDVVEEIPLDVSGLEVGDHLTVGDIALPPGLTVLTDPEILVASVVLPSAEKSEAEEEEDAAAGVEPEIIGGKQEETE